MLKLVVNNSPLSETSAPSEPPAGASLGALTSVEPPAPGSAQAEPDTQVKKANAQIALSTAVARPEIDVEKVLLLTGGSAANGDNSSPVVFESEVELQARAYIAAYGFERLPLTYGELFGLIEYCRDLDSITGRYMFQTEMERKIWQGDYKVWRRHQPEMFPAVELYAAYDLQGLRKLHREQDTLTKLGLSFKEFE